MEPHASWASWAPEQRRHAQAWSAVGCLHLAFKMIGNPQVHHSRETHRALDAMSAVSLACRHAKDEAIDSWKATVTTGHRRVKRLAVLRGFDETPIKCTFACLQSQLAPIARYFRRAKRQTATSV